MGGRGAEACAPGQPREPREAPPLPAAEVRCAHPSVPESGMKLPLFLVDPSFSALEVFV